MEETQQIQLNVIVSDSEDKVPPQTTDAARRSSKASLIWWIKILTYSFLNLGGQSASVLLGRLYYEKGGQSKWMETLVQFAGFPILIPFYYICSSKTNQKDEDQYQESNTKLHFLKLGAVYISLGLLITGTGILYSVGVLYLPVSTFTLITASQLAFTSVFSFFMVGQKFTPYIVNSVVILTISSILLIFQNESSNNTVTKSQYAIGFVCAVGTSAGSALTLPFIQYSFQKVIKVYNFKTVLELLVYSTLTACCVAIIGLFISGEWKTLKGEMELYTLGKVSYLITVIGAAIIWQVFYLGSVTLVLEVSSLFSNVIGTLGLPTVPILAVFIFHDKMDGVKVVALIMAIWGFISYAYQCYLDDQRSKAKEEETV